MNSKRVDAAAAVLLATVKQGKTLPVSWAYALESACLLQSPETAAELLAYQSLELGAVDGRVSAACGNSEHPTWLRGRDDTRGCPWCRVAELEAERHSTNETLNDAMVALAEARDRIAELEALKPAPIQTCGTCGAGYTYGQSCSTCEFEARIASELATRQQPAEDPHDSPLHHDYALGRDLPTTHPTDAGSAL